MKIKLLTPLALASALCATSVHAQQTTPAQNEGTGSLMSDIIVTAQKKSAGEKAQDVPIAITALGSLQLASLNVRSLADVATLAPNATLDDNGTYRGYANFTIRGAGVNGSVPSVEPAVGLFVNGVYQGIPAGSTNSNFDIASLQVLRGPQGTLFGRNVVGGAVVIETARPGNAFGGFVTGSIETGPEYSLAGAVDVPVVTDKVNARLAGYYRNDEGWFHNDFTGKKVGKLETYFFRPTVVITPTDRITQTFIGEYGKVKGDGVIFQRYNPSNRTKSFDVSYNDEGATDQRWRSITSETVIDVGFGNGNITNVMGYRDFKSYARLDADGTEASLASISTTIDQDQFSDELRYAGQFGRLDLTAGGFYMYQYLEMQDARAPWFGSPRGGGGVQRSHSYGLFTQGTYHLTDTLNLIAGVRYSYETKRAIIAPITPGRCVDARVQCDFAAAATVNGKRNWDNASPKFGIDYKINNDVLVYASYGQAVRSGGYNLRITSPLLDPGTYDTENLTAYEAGIKTDLFNRHVRLNLSGFINEYKNLQRIVAIQGGLAQIVNNAADARIPGVEAELILRPADGLEFPLSVGYLDAHFTDVFGDLNGDGVINRADRDLKLVRTSKWSGSAGISYAVSLKNDARLQTQLFYSYRSRQASLDDNSLFFPSRSDLRFNLRYEFSDKKTIATVFARNLLNEVIDASNDVRIPGVGPIRSIGEGRSIGISFERKF